MPEGCPPREWTVPPGKYRRHQARRPFPPRTSRAWKTKQTKDDEAALLSPDEDDAEDLSLLPDLSLPPEDDEDESAEDAAADEADAGSEAVEPFRLSVR